MARQKEKIINTRIGKRTVELDKTLYFPHGLIGFESQREFILLQIKEDSPFLILQSMITPRVGLLVADPYSFTSSYEVKLGEAEQKILRLKNIRQLAVLVTVSIPAGEPEKTALNLSGPIIVNYEARIGLQVPQVDAKYQGHIFLNELIAGGVE